MWPDGKSWLSADLGPKKNVDGREIPGYFNKKSRLLKYSLILIEFWPDGWSVGVGAMLEGFLVHRVLDWKWVRFVYKSFVWHGDMKSVIGELGQGLLQFLAAPLIWYMDSWYLPDKEQTQDSLFLVIHMTLRWFITVGLSFPPNPWHFHPIHSSSGRWPQACSWWLWKCRLFGCAQWLRRLEKSTPGDVWPKDEAERGVNSSRHYRQICNIHWHFNAWC